MIKDTGPRSPIVISRHGRARAQQRGTSMRMICTTVEHADLEVSLGNGLTALSLSRRAREEAIADGLAGAGNDRCGRRVIIVAANGTIVTVMADTGRRTRHYRFGRYADGRNRLARRK